MAAKMSTSFYNSLEDLTQLCGPFTDDVIVKALQQRYSSGRRLTSLGPVLISVNTNNSSHGIRALVDTGSHEPAIQNLAESLLLQLKDSGQNQCLLLHGISGSGKTFLLHQTLRCLFSAATAASMQTDAFKHCSAALTILQPLTSAATASNPDSSRIALRIETQFADCALYHTKMDYLLFDQTRIHNTPAGERNFHIFYQFMDGLSPDEKEKLHLAGHNAQSLNYLNGYQSDQREVQWNRMRYNAWKLALAELGVPLSDIARVLAAILLLGNVTFVDADDTGPQQLEVLGHRELKAAASLLGVSGPALFSALSQRRVHAATGAPNNASGSVTTDAATASKVRDSLVRALYTQTLRILVRRFNTLKRPESRSSASMANSSDSSSEIGSGPGRHVSSDSSSSSTTSTSSCVGGSIHLFDLGGFEAGSFPPQQQQQQRSRLDQLAVNLIAERTQNWYEHCILREAAEAAVQEGLATGHLGDSGGFDSDELGVETAAADDVDSLLLLLMHPRTGIATLVNHFSIDDASTGFMEALRQLHTVNDHPFQSNPPDRRCFGIRHTFSRVLYDSADFASANNPIQQSAASFGAIFQPKTCSFAFACYLFRHSQSSSNNATVDSRGATKAATLMDQTVAFLRSCEAAITPCEKTFVLCLKPNSVGESCLFDRSYIAQQCRSMRLATTLDRLNCRLSHRLGFVEFERRVGFLLRATSLNPEAMPRDRCRALVNAFLHAVELHNLPYRDCKCAFGVRSVFFNEDFRQQLAALRLAIVAAEAAATAARTVSVHHPTPTQAKPRKDQKSFCRPLTVESPVRRQQSRAGGQVQLRRLPRQFGSCDQLADLPPQKSQSLSDLRQICQAFVRPTTARLFRKPETQKPEIPERKSHHRKEVNSGAMSATEAQPPAFAKRHAVRNRSRTPDAPRRAPLGGGVRSMGTTSTANFSSILV